MAPFPPWLGSLQWASQVVLVVKNSTCQCSRCQRCGFNPWVGKIPLEESMAARSTTFSWRILWTEEPDGTQSMESQGVGHNWSDLACNGYEEMVAFLTNSEVLINTWTPTIVHFIWMNAISTLLFSLSVVSDYMQPHGLYPAKPPCPSQSPGVCSDSCLLSRWYHPTISFSVIPFSSCLQSFAVSESFPVKWLFVSGGQSTGASTSAPVLLMNVQSWFPLGLICLISLLFKGLSRVFSTNTVWRNQFFRVQSFLLSDSHIHTWLLGKP